MAINRALLAVTLMLHVIIFILELFKELYAVAAARYRSRAQATSRATAGQAETCARASSASVSASMPEATCRW